MKIEIGESLLMSWLKHVKGCQLVQMNWKASSIWELQNRNDLDLLMSHSASRCSSIGYDIYKKTSSLEQLLAQAEIDILGVNFSEAENSIYAIDVAFHEAGLNYGSKEETIARVIKKIIRTAMCVHGYFNSKKVQIVFASPKINPATNEDLAKAIYTVKEILTHSNINYDIRIIANQEFKENILTPVLHMLGDVADTSELFMRSLQLYNMFIKEDATPKKTITRQTSQRITSSNQKVIQAQGIAGLEEMKVGAIAKTLLRDILESGKIPMFEIKRLQSKEYSKSVFGLQYPLLVLADEETYSERPHRYYKDRLKIHGRYYFMCSEWYETLSNNDKSYLIKWLSKYKEGES